MKKLLFIITLAAASSALNASAQSYTYRDQYGMPQGSSNWNQYNRSWQFRDQYGMPQGSAQYNQFNNSWQLRDQYGIPQGSITRQPSYGLRHYSW
jgi:hypothetical protein